MVRDRNQRRHHLRLGAIPESFCFTGLLRNQARVDAVARHIRPVCDSQAEPGAEEPGRRRRAAWYEAADPGRAVYRDEGVPRRRNGIR